MVMATIKIKTLSTGQVADLMGLSTASVRRFAIDGLLKGRRHGARAWVFDDDVVKKFIRSYEASLDKSLGGGPRGPRSRGK
jgi:phage terminase Nu1 subunit (DNA packaging protein)